MTGQATAPQTCRESPGEATAHVELAAIPLTPFWARRHAQAVLGAWQLDPDTIETAALLTSELITNAVTAMARLSQELPDVSRRPITHTLRLQAGRLVIEVSDSDPSPPVPEQAGPEAESGRGLMLVAMLSKEWSYFCPPSGGKTVYCVISCES
jgi:anti-sigma regulatory factor (Ser/Thr protein kinase)